MPAGAAAGRPFVDTADTGLRGGADAEVVAGVGTRSDVRPAVGQRTVGRCAIGRRPDPRLTEEAVIIQGIGCLPLASCARRVDKRLRSCLFACVDHAKHG